MTSPWPSEEIPNEDLLYMRVLRERVRADGTVSPGVFKNLPTDNHGMSTDWSKYRTNPQEVREGSARRPPSDFRVIKMIVGDVRQISEQSVVHTPNWEMKNRAHTDVFGPKSDKDVEIRLRFVRAASLVPEEEG